MKPERHAWLGFLPLIATAVFYGLPDFLQAYLLIQFLPQIFAYVIMGVWLYHNDHIFFRLGLSGHLFQQGLLIGGRTGVLLGAFNCLVILWIVPTLGLSIDFLTETPHALVSTWLMVPWGIIGIAVAVELNFRGFLLGRLFWFSQEVFGARESAFSVRGGGAAFLAVCGSALVFAFDPFMVSTFQHLHWIAVWDGMIWGWLWVRTQNLYVTCVAHAVEVIILYLTMKYTLM